MFALFLKSFYCFLIVDIFFIYFGVFGNDVFSVNGITYTIITDERVPWYEAYKKCTTNTDGSYRYMAEFPDLTDDWEDVEDEISTDRTWIGLVLIDDEAWWTGGREFKETDNDDDYWRGTKPFTQTYSESKCTKLRRLGGRYRLYLEDCDDDRYAFCQDIIKPPESPFLLGNTDVFAFINDADMDSSGASSFCQETDASLAILDTEQKNIAAHQHLSTYLTTAGAELFYIGLNVVSGSRTWSDDSSLSYSGLSSADSNDLSRACVVIDSSAGSYNSNWRPRTCSNSAKTLCTQHKGNAVKYRQNYYLFVDSLKSFDDAQSYCSDRSSQLVTIIDPALQAFLVSFVEYQDAPNRWWIGLTNRVNNNWNWASGRDLEYTQWDSSSSSGSNRCAALDGDSSFNWVRVSSCDSLEAFICQSGEPITANPATTTQPTTEPLVTTVPTTTSSTTNQPTTVTTAATTSPVTTAITTTNSPTTTEAATTTAASTPCEDDPCIHGACTDFDASYNCTCDNDFVGENCDTSSPFFIKDYFTEWCIHYDINSNDVFITKTCSDDEWHMLTNGQSHNIYLHNTSLCLDRDLSTNQLIVSDHVDSTSCSNFTWFNDGLFRVSNLCLTTDRSNPVTSKGKRLYFQSDCNSVTERFTGPPFTCTDEGWSEWINRDDQDGPCDCELLEDIRQEFPGRVCENPSTIEARFASSELAIDPSISNLVFANPKEGLNCTNSASRTCEDYEIRFCCLPDKALWIDVEDSLLFPGSSGNLWSSSNDEVNVDKVAFSFNTWLTISQVSISLPSDSPLESFYLETSSDLLEAHSTNWTNLPSSFIPESFKLEFNASVSSTQRFVFDIESQVYTETLILASNETSNNESIEIERFQVYAQNVSLVNCFLYIFNASISQSSDQSFSNEEQALNKCFETDPPCTGYDWDGTGYRVTHGEDSFLTNQSGKIAHLNNCRDLVPRYLIIATLNDEQRFLQPGTPLYGDWLPVQEGFNFALPFYKLPPFRYSEYLMLRGCAPTGAASGEIHRFSKSECDDNEIFRFFVSNSNQQQRLRYSENIPSPHNGLVSFDSADSSQWQSKFDFFVDQVAAIDYKFTSLKLSDGFYSLDASSRRSGHNDNHARRGDIWPGWMPDESDAEPLLNIDLWDTRRVSGIAIDVCTEDSFIGDFQLLFAPSSHPTKFSNVRNGNGEVNFNVDVETLKQHESLLFIFERTISAEYVRFVPDLSYLSSNPGVQPCVKLELFGHQEPGSPSGFASITKFELGTNTTENIGKTFNFVLHLSSGTQDACFAVYFDDDTRRVMYRSVPGCSDEFDDVTGETSNFMVANEEVIHFTHWFPEGTGAYNVRAAYFDGTNDVYFDDVITLSLGSHAEVESLVLGALSEGHYNVNITVQISSERRPLCAFLDFGDSSEKTLFFRSINDTDCAANLNLNESDYALLEVANVTETFTIDHRYRSSETFNISTTYYNGTDVIPTKPLIAAEVLFVDCSVTFLLEKAAENLTVFKSRSLKLSAYLDIDCQGTPYSQQELNVLLTWRKLDCTTRNEVQNFDQFVGVSANFLPNSLSFGCQLIQSTLSVYNPHLDLRREYNVEQLVMAVSSPLTVYIKGGLLTTVSRRQDHQVDAETNSFDPDSPDINLLTFVFDYQLAPAGPIFTIGNNSTTEQPPVKLTGSRNGILLISLPSDDISDNITVTVHVSASQGRTASYTQFITLTDIQPPKVEVRCVRNCLSNVINPIIASVFGIYFLEERTDPLTYHWSFSTENNTILDASNLDTTTRYVETYGNYFSEGAYNINCHVTDLVTGGSARVAIAIATGTYPYGGSCSVSPTLGVSLQTKFVFGCEDWQSDGHALFYSYNLVTESGMTLLKHTAAMLTAPVLLPAGKSSQNHIIKILIQICQLQTFCNTTTLDIQVLPPTQNDTEKAFFKLETTASTLDVSVFSQVASALLSSENDTENGNSTKASSSVVDSLRNIVTSSSAVQSVDEFAILSGVSLGASRSAKNSSFSTLLSGSLVMEVLSLNLNQFSMQNDGSLSAEQTTSNSKSLLGTASNVLAASRASTSGLQEQLLQSQFEQHKPEPDEANDISPREIYYNNLQKAKIQQFENEKTANDRKSIVSCTVGSTRSIASAMTDQKLSVANNVASVKNEGLDVSVVTIGSGNGSLTAGDGGAAVKFANTQIEQSVKIVSVETNPFVFDDDASLVNSAVILAQTDAGDNPDNGLEIKLTNPQSSAQFEKYNLEYGRLSVSRFEVNSVDTSILLYLIPSIDETQIKIWIRKGRQATVVGYTDDPSIKEDIADFVYSLPVLGASSKEDKYKYLLSSTLLNGAGTYFQTVLATPVPNESTRKRRSIDNTTTENLRNNSSDNSTVANTSTSSVELSSGIFDLNCVAFDESTASWSGSICQATKESSFSETICTCTSLPQSSFVAAQFNAAPNFIDFSSVFSKIDLLNNGAVFFTITAFIVILLLLLLWARREDKKDIIKWSTKHLVDNQPTDTYHYKISVVTGMGQYAGTQSNVYLVLTGENDRTEVKELTDSSNKHWFKRSSVVHFMMSTPACLGNLEFLHIWHDNSGPGRTGGNWFLTEVVVQDLHSGQVSFFPCYDWLALEHGDGSIRRVLPVAEDDNLKTYKHVFTSTMREKLVNDFLWFSIFADRNRSNFTRCQRLACAAVALFLAMIASAMFYRDTGESEEESDATMIEIGPVSIDPMTLYVSTVASLIVLIPSVLVVQIFRKTDVRRNGVHDASMRSISESNTRKPYMLAYWFTYIAWLICVLAVVASGFFTILYSFQWGKEKSEKWLSSVLLSFAQDSVFIQPLKVVVIAAIIAAICRKSTDMVKNWKEQNEEFLITPPQTSNNKDSSLPEQLDASSNIIRNVLFHRNEDAAVTSTDERTTIETDDLDPSSADKGFQQHPDFDFSRDIAKLRRRRIIEKKAVSYITDFLIYLVYVAILFYIAYAGHQDRDFFLESSQLQTVFVTDDFQSITTLEDFWSYLEEALIPATYSNTKYNGVRKKWRDRVFLDDDVNYRVGPMRLRQVRVKESECDIERLHFYNLFRTSCGPAYIIYDEDTQSYSTGWTTYNRSHLDLNSDFWIFRDSAATKSLPTIGRTVTLYGGGGYTVDLGNSLDFAINTTQYLKHHLWLDRFTRAVFIEFTVLNVNLNVFTTAVLLAEFLPTAGFVPTSYFAPFRLYALENSNELFAASIVATVMILYYISQTIACLVKEKRKFFKKIWNYFGIIRILLFLSYVGLFLYSYDLQRKTVTAFQQNTYLYANFHSLASIRGALRNMIGALLFFETVQILQFFKYQKQMRKFSLFFILGRKIIAEFFGLFCLSLLAFVFIALIVFSASAEDFQTFIKTFLSLSATLLGNPTYENLNQISPVLGKLFYFIFNAQLTYLTLNFLIGVVDVMLHVASSQVTKKKDGKDHYFHIFYGLTVNSIRQFLRMEEKKISYFENCAESENEASDNEEEQTEVIENKHAEKKVSAPTDQQPERKNKRRWKKLAKLNPTTQKRRSIVDNKLDDVDQLLVLHRLMKDLERAVDDIDVELIESVEREKPVDGCKSSVPKQNYADMALKALDDIFSDIEELMKVD